VGKLPEAERGFALLPRRFVCLLAHRAGALLSESA
jgi:hypothetical protein